VLVTHDRYMLDRVSTIVLGLDGQGGAESFADYAQWETWQADRKQPAKAVRSSGHQPRRTPFVSEPPASKKKLSYLEAREYATIEERVAEAEEVLQQKRAQLEDPAIASDGPSLMRAHAEMDEAQKVADDLYSRWAELEQKKG
jgi:ABC transport system ATP-binding/permease protein